MADAAFLGAESSPKILDALADAGDRTEAGDDDAAAFISMFGSHDSVTLCASTCAFMQRKVSLAMLRMKKFADDRVDHRRERGNAKFQVRAKSPRARRRAFR